MQHTAGNVKTFSCPVCGGTIAIRALGISIHAFCQYCTSAVDVTNENLKTLKHLYQQIRPLTIPIGSRGILFDEEWEVIGYVERKTHNIYTWDEYLLFNPWQGFRFLVCSEDHWTFVKMIHAEIEKKGIYEIKCAGEVYQLYAEETAKVDYVLGEFYWQIKLGEETHLADYIAPPYILSKEENSSEVIWSQGIYIQKKLIEQAFKLSSLPKPQTIAPNQPSWIGKHISGIMRLLAIYIILLFVVQFFAASLATEEVIFSKVISTTSTAKGQVILSEPLELTGRTSNIEFSVFSPVQNNWVALNLALNNDQTEETFESSQEVEYYSGSDDEGSWSEGQQISTNIISAVPPGKYHLLIMPDAGAYDLGLPAEFQLTVKRSVTVLSNFFIALFALLIYPLVMLKLHISFEKRRWLESDFTPKKYRRSP